MKIQNSISTEILKKSQDVVKNIVGDLLDKSFENSKRLEEVAKALNKGVNLNIKA